MGIVRLICATVGLSGLETFRIFGLEPGSDPPRIEAHGALIHEDDRKAVTVLFDRCLREQHPFDLVYRILHAKGGFKYVHSLGEMHYDDSGHPVRMVGTLQDVTDLRNAQLEIEQHRDRIASIVSAVPTGSGVVQGTDRIITEVNEKFCETTGFANSEVVGRTAQILYPGPEEFEFVGRKKYRLIREHGTGAVETRWKRKDGSTIDVWLASAPIHPKEIERGVTFSVLDITERKRAEEALRVALSEKELLPRETHHRVKNNMAIMESLLSLQAERQADAHAREVLLDAAGRARSMSVLYGKLYRPNFTNRILLGEFVPPLMEEITSALDISVPLQTEFDFEEIMLDSRFLSPLGLIINELITNSLKYALPHTSSGRVRLAAKKEGTVARFVFEDNGPGLPEPVFKEESKGFGLQLCDTLARQMGGSFAVERGSGARFSVTFPLVT